MHGGGGAPERHGQSFLDAFGDVVCFLGIGAWVDEDVQAPARGASSSTVGFSTASSRSS